MRYSTESFYSNHRVLINISIFFFFYRQIPFHCNTETKAECDFGRVLLQIFMQRRFFFFCFGQNGISPGQFSHCEMDWLQYKNKKGSYKSLQVDRVRRHRAGWLWNKRGTCCSKKKNWGSRGVLAAIKKMKQRNAKALGCTENAGGGGWRKPQVFHGENLHPKLQVAAGTGCEEHRKRGGAEPEHGENPPSARPGQASTCSIENVLFLSQKNGLREGSQRNSAPSTGTKAGDRTGGLRAFFPSWDELKSRSDMWSTRCSSFWTQFQWWQETPAPSASLRSSMQGAICSKKLQPENTFR